jgi:2-polyprenyl-6-methoxyphenol hydroxylase-like FAD-dependent oxidoreductase
VEIYESFPGNARRSYHHWNRPFSQECFSTELKALGDIISFGPNAGRIFRRWSNGAVADRLRPLCINLQSHGFKIHKWTGELVHTQLSPPRDPDAPVFNGHRGELHTVVFNYAKDDLGIPIHLGQRVMKYFEDENQAGIVLNSGERVRYMMTLLGT